MQDELCIHSTDNSQQSQGEIHRDIQREREGKRDRDKDVDRVIRRQRQGCRRVIRRQGQGRRQKKSHKDTETKT